MSSTLPIDQMIDSQRGIISREIFVSPEFHKEELEKLFTRAWLFVGHESQIPKPGDFFVSRMGQESVILCRDSKGAVHVFLPLRRLAWVATSRSLLPRLFPGSAERRFLVPA